MPRSKKSKDYQLHGFGCMTGFLFEKGGYAMIRMNALELRRLLETYREFESAKKKPDNKTLSAINLLCKKVFGQPFYVHANVVISRHKARVIADNEVVSSVADLNRLTKRLKH